MRQLAVVIGLSLLTGCAKAAPARTEVAQYCA